MLSVVVIHIKEYPTECVRSVLENTLGDVEVVVVLSLFEGEVPATDPRVRVVTFKERVPVPKAYNVGLAMVRGEYVTPIGGDMVVLPDWNAYPLLAMKVWGERFGFVGGVPQGDADRLREGMLRHFTLLPAGSVFDTAILRRLGNFNETYAEGMAFEDDELLLRFVRNGFQPTLLSVVTWADAPDVPHDNHIRVFTPEEKAERFRKNFQRFIKEHHGISAGMGKLFIPLRLPPITVNGKRLEPPFYTFSHLQDLVPTLPLGEDHKL